MPGEALNAILDDTSISIQQVGRYSSSRDMTGVLTDRQHEAVDIAVELGVELGSDDVPREVTLPRGDPRGADPDRR